MLAIHRLAESFSEMKQQNRQDGDECPDCKDDSQAHLSLGNRGEVDIVLNSVDTVKYLVVVALDWAWVTCARQIAGVRVVGKGDGDGKGAEEKIRSWRCHHLNAAGTLERYSRRLEALKL